MSTRSRCHGRTEGESGFAIAGALVLAFLFFALVALLMIESTAVMQQASRFRARIAAETLSESAAEIAALRMISTKSDDEFSEEVSGGVMEAKWKRSPTGNPAVDAFVIIAKGRTNGIPQVERTTKVYGQILGSNIQLIRTVHAND